MTHDGLTKYQRYYASHRDKKLAWTKEWRKRNKTRIKQYMKEWIGKQPHHYWKRWKSRKLKTGLGRWPMPGRTYEQTLEANRILRKKKCEELSDSYLRGWMSRTTGYAIKPSEWPNHLVELKRAQIKIVRLCRKSKQMTN